jgi:hypothetical protein
MRKAVDAVETLCGKDVAGLAPSESAVQTLKALALNAFQALFGTFRVIFML